MSHIPQMRTLPEAARELQESDPNTRLTLAVLRRLVKAGTIPCVRSGRWVLIDLSKLSDYLRGAENEGAKEAKAKIRQIAE